MEKKVYYSYRAKYVQKSQEPQPTTEQFTDIEAYLDSLTKSKKTSEKSEPSTPVS